ncbi:hypothetical protein FQV27_12395 [Paracoccus aurantiacus]|uniref:Uncharacterized protein n=1 Tax=Paracoccus aurantiacus TaxID=2599412 RepID=A0A5C6S2R4_9RHOB|nr:hypothetical protein [Paracoccus aurantiacus]TXB68768.1 hypothetical protein FQV27_12395 [Paracoccus aurantiacus]
MASEFGQVFVMSVPPDVCRTAALAAVLTLWTVSDVAQAQPAPADGVQQAASKLLPIPAGSTQVSGEIIVKLRGTSGDTPPLLPFRDADMLGLQGAPDIRPGGALIYRLSYDALLSAGAEEEVDRELSAIAAELVARDDVVYVQPNWVASGKDQVVDQLWGR